MGYDGVSASRAFPWSSMAGVTLSARAVAPALGPVGRTLVIGSPAGRALPVEQLLQLGYTCSEAEEPYSAMAEICRRPLAFRSVVLCLNSVYREELPVIGTLKRRFPHVQVWLTQTDGRPAALAEASRLGADGLLSEEGLHLFGLTETPKVERQDEPQPPAMAGPAPQVEEPPLQAAPAGEPVLTAEELRALLEDPVRPQRGEGV